MTTEDKKIEALINKLMSADGLELPSVDFTDKVISKLEAISNSTATVYKPLISKLGWVFIIGSFLALVAYVYFKEPEVNKGWFHKIGWFNSSLNSMTNVSFNFSVTAMYAFAFLAIMIVIQVPLLKYYFNKRMTF